RTAFRPARYLPLRPGHVRLLLAGECASVLHGEARRRIVRAGSEPARPALRGRVRLPDRAARRLYRRQAGGSAIIAVKLAWAASLPSTLARPANLHTLARFWTNSTSSLR